MKSNLVTISPDELIRLLSIESISPESVRQVFKNKKQIFWGKMAVIIAAIAMKNLPSLPQGESYVLWGFYGKEKIFL